MDDALRQRLQAVRRHFGISASEMAEMVGLSDRKSWENYERGTNAPKANVLSHLAERGIDLNWLMTGSGTMVARPAPPDAAAAPLDAAWMGEVMEGVMEVYRAENARVGPRQAAEEAARIYSDIQVGCADDDNPDLRRALLRVMLRRLRDGLHSTDPATQSKRRA